MGANDVTAMLPCPFCGSKSDLGVFPESYLTGDSGDDGYRAACDFVRSGCGARSIWCATEADAVAAWNRRAPAPQGAAPADPPPIHFVEQDGTPRRLVWEYADKHDGLRSGYVAEDDRRTAPAAPAQGWVDLPSAPHHGGAFRIYAKIPPSGKPVEELPIANAVARELFSYAYGLEAEVGRLKAISATAQGSPQEGEALDLEAIEVRANAATPGPWFNAQAQDGEILPDGSGYAGDYYDTTEILAYHEDDPECFIGRIDSEADRAFVIHARQDIPALIREVRRLRSALAKAEGGPA